MDNIKSYGVIYAITNKVNGKVYVGETTDFETRMQRYKKLRCKGQRKIYNALKKYGVNNFFYEIIDTGSSKKELNILEDYHITLARSRDNAYGYNIRKGGGSHGKHSEETKKKTAETMTGKKRPPRSPEWNRKISEALKGRRYQKHTPRRKKLSYDKLTKEQRGDIISKANKGRHFTEEHKRKLSEARKGKKHSQETLRKMSEVQSIVTNSEEYKTKMSMAQKGRTFSPETLIKMSIAHKGQKRSEETKRKIGVNSKAMWEKKRK